MKKAIRSKITSDYLGAGSYVVSGDRAIVGTEYGVQCVSRSGSEAACWKGDLGSRCLGVIPGGTGVIVAACLKGLFAMTENGEQRWGTHSMTQVVHGPVLFQGGILLTSRQSLHFLQEWSSAGWRFDFCDVLGQSVEAVRVVNIFGLDQYVIAGVVDYDSGIGRVIVIHGKSGRRVWMSDPGPLSELFPAGQSVFVWCQTGYGKFETRMTRIDGHEIWHKEIAGVGTPRHDGSLAMLVGSNESPAWDDWEYCQISPGGKLEKSVRGKGRCVARPLCLKDGTVYFMGSSMLEPAGVRAEDTRFLPIIPLEILFQHLMGIKPEIPRYEIYLHRLRPDSSSPDVLYRRAGTFSLGDLQAVDQEIFFCDGKEILSVES